MIRSVCSGCGDSKLVSKYDGSLREWEDGHYCAAAQDKKKNPARAADPIALRFRKRAGRKSGGGSSEAS